MRRTALLLLFAAFPLVAGCAWANRVQGLQEVKAKYDPKHKRMLIIPFSDPAFTYFESAEGAELSSGVGAYIRGQKITEVAFDAVFPRGLDTIYAQKLAELNELKNTKEGNELEAWKALAKEMGCELILVGQIEGFEPVARRDVNIIRATVTFQVQLYDTKQNDMVVFRMPSTTATYPEGMENDEVMPRNDMPLSQLRFRLFRKAGEVIGRCFHDHKEQI